MDFYSKKTRYTFEHWINIISVFGVFFLFFNGVLYFFSGIPIYIILGFIGIIMMGLRMVKWYDD